MISIEQATLTYAGADEPSLRNVSLHVPRGQALLVCGESGCGKTSLTRLINGLAIHFDEAQLTGNVHVGALDVVEAPLYDTARVVGSVFQNPRSQFFCVDVTSEVAFGCENLGIPEDEVCSRVEHTAAVMQMERLLGRSIFKLSGGQKQKVACASVAAMAPDLYVLDEPSSNLDADAMALLHEVLRQWKAQGKTIVIAEHRLGWLMDVVDRVVVMEHGEVSFDMATSTFAALSLQELATRGLRPLKPDFEEVLAVPAASRMAMAPDAGCAAATLACENFRFSYGSRTSLAAPALDIDHLRLSAGEIVPVIGHNGAGKSTFSHCLCGLERRFKGIVRLDDGSLPLRRRELLRRSFLVMQDVNHQLFCESVSEEVRLGMDSERESQVTEILADLGLNGLEDRHPFSLSGGQKQRVAIASALLAGKDILVFDEPTSGQDLRHMRATARLIAGLRRRATVLVVTHDPEFILSCCTYVLHLEQGSVLDSYELDAVGRRKLAGFFEKDDISAKADQKEEDSVEERLHLKEAV